MERDRRDSEHIERVLGGDTEAFAWFVDRYGDRVFALVSGIVRSREDAEEIVSDVFLKAYSRLRKFRGEARFSTWLYRIAYNTAISSARRRRHTTVEIDEQRLEVEDDGAYEALFREAELERLEAAIAQLPPDERAILDMFYTARLPIEEIAEITSLSVGNVRVKLHRIRRRLANQLTKKGELYEKQ